MNNKQGNIEQYGLSAPTNAGVFIVDMQNAEREQHDTSKPHRDNHYLLMLATAGHFKLNLDFEEVEFSAPSLICVFPGQVHHTIQADNPQGWIIGFEPTLINNELQDLLENKLSRLILFKEQLTLYRQAASIMDLIIKLQSDIVNTHTIKSIHALLNALLHLIAGKIVDPSPDKKQAENRGIVIKDNFNRLLKKKFKDWKQPAQYASELALSVSHLNDTIKELTGIPISQHIQQTSILEAKRLLYFTDKSAKEIAYEVGYDEPIYFGKLFKKITTLTPLEFRKQFRD